MRAKSEIDPKSSLGVQTPGKKVARDKSFSLVGAGVVRVVGGFLNVAIFYGKVFKPNILSAVIK